MTLLTAIALLSLALGLVSALWLACDVIRRPQHMAIMALVWPLCGLFAGPILLAFYLRHGRAPLSQQGGAHGDHGHQHDHHHHHASQTPFPASVASGTLHCGAGCTLGDILAETLAALAPGVLAVFGYPGLFSDRIFAAWGLDFAFAFVIGILFQYYAIVPMRGLSPRRGIIEALKADALSLISWQIGMYGVMAIARFAIFGHPLSAATPVFWFTMQIAMLAGFITAYPTNWALIRLGVKEPM
ncbi:DUF4396 domain-containing protein [Thioclava sp. BHET1]|nr:DUF4396 domain-containing protein [Thioclava sp. BHET1]